MFNIPDDQLRLIACLLFSYPLGFIVSYLGLFSSPIRLHQQKRAFWRHLFVGSLGAFLGYLCYGTVATLHFMASAVYSYVLMWIPHALWNHHGSHKAHKGTLRFTLLTCLLMLLHLSYCHIDRQWHNDGNSVDMSGPMMILTIKITSFAWNIYDGARSLQSQTQTERRTAIRTDQFPTVVQYFGFLFFFPSFLTGPSFEYHDYIYWTEHNSGVSHVITPRETWWPSLLCLLQSLFFAGLHLLCTLPSTFPPLKFVSAEFIAPPATSWALLRRWIWMYGFSQGLKAKFYFVWRLSEGGCIAAGAGFNLKTQQWDGLSNVDTFALETASTLQAIMRHWNTKTHHWLKHYIYIRVLEYNASSTHKIKAESRHSQTSEKNAGPSDKCLSSNTQPSETTTSPVLTISTGNEDKPDEKRRRTSSSSRIFVATLLTSLISAFWHGFYPGYYLTFGTSALIGLMESSMRRHIQPYYHLLLHKLPKGVSIGLDRLVHLLAVCVSQMLLGYTVIPFALGVGDLSLKAWSGVYYIGHIYWLVMMLVCQTIRFMCPLKKSETKKQK